MSSAATKLSLALRDTTAKFVNSNSIETLTSSSHLHLFKKNAKIMQQENSIDSS